MSSFADQNEKLRRLDSVFNKAVSVASNSVTDSDLQDCFGDLKDQYGNTLQKLFINILAKTQANIEVSPFIIKKII